MTDRSREPGGRGPRPVRMVAACLLAAAMSGAAGCGGEISPPGPVLLVGDSIFAQASEELSWVLRSDGWDATVEAHPGAGIRGGGYDGVDWPTRLRDLVAVVDPRVVVVELGTNGCGGCDSVAAAIRDDMEQLRDVEAVLWLDVATHGPRAAQGREVNAALARAAERWPNVEVLPYDDWLAGQPDLLPPDDVHPTAAGERALAGHVGDTLRERSDTSADLRQRGLGALVVAIAAAMLVGGKSRT